MSRCTRWMYSSTPPSPTVSSCRRVRTPRNRDCRRWLTLGVRLRVRATVLEETRNQNLQLYNRLRACTADPTKHFPVFSNEHHRGTYVERQPGESSNDRNDRAIRKAAEWYGAHLAPSGAEVLLVSNDVGNREEADKSGLRSISVHKLVHSMKNHPELQDVLASNDEGDRPGSGQVASKAIFSEHLPLSEVMAGVRCGTLRQGVFHANAYNLAEAYVSIQATNSAPQADDHEWIDPLTPQPINSVLISGLEAHNRATDGDVVAVRMLPEADWAAPSDRIMEDDSAAAGEEEVQVRKNRPCAQVVGIIRRAWRPYCGTLHITDEQKKTLTDGVSASLLFVPVEKTIPRVRIRTRQAATLAKKRIVVSIDGCAALHTVRASA